MPCRAFHVPSFLVFSAILQHDSSFIRLSAWSSCHERTSGSMKKQQGNSAALHTTLQHLCVQCSPVRDHWSISLDSFLATLNNWHSYSTHTTLGVKCLAVRLLHKRSWRPSGFSVKMHAIHFFRHSVHSVRRFFHITTSCSTDQNSITFNSLVVASSELRCISISSQGLPASPQATMRTYYSLLWLLKDFGCAVVFANGETQFGSGVIDKVVGVVGGNVAQAEELAPVSLGVPHGGPARPWNKHG